MHAHKNGNCWDAMRKWLSFLEMILQFHMKMCCVVDSGCNIMWDWYRDGNTANNQPYNQSMWRYVV